MPFGVGNKEKLAGELGKQGTNIIIEQFGKKWEQE